MKTGKTPILIFEVTSKKAPTKLVFHAQNKRGGGGQYHHLPWSLQWLKLPKICMIKMVYANGMPKGSSVHTPTELIRPKAEAQSSRNT